MLRYLELDQVKDKRLIEHVEEAGQFVCLGMYEPPKFKEHFLKTLILLFVVLPLTGFIAAAMTIGLYIGIDFFINLEQKLGSLLNPSLYVFFGIVATVIMFLVGKRIFKNKVQIDEDEVLVVIKDSEFPINTRTYQIHDFILDGFKNHLNNKY